MMVLFKANKEFEVFFKFQDKKILNLLSKMDKEELRNTEIAIFVDTGGDAVQYYMYSDGHYIDKMDYDKTLDVDCDYILRLESSQVITPSQYDLRGQRVISYSDNKKGKVASREVTARGVKYWVLDDDGNTFVTFDADLEIIGA